MTNKLYGIALSILLSLILIFFFFGKNLRNLNDTYFSISGDGFKAYYCAIFHVKYDTVDYKTSAMNYPFGELTTFTDGQPLVSNSVRLLNRLFSFPEDSVVALLNGLMLLAFILGALFIFLIFYETGIVWWFGALASVGIAMLSPQVARFGGHYSLSWLVWIPAMIYWLMRFDKTRSWIYSLMIGLTTFLAGKMHLYFMGFAGFLVGGYWLYRFFCYSKTKTVWSRDLINLFIQLLLPLLIVQVGILIYDQVTDRTIYPYGFKAYLGHPAAVFLPSGKPWSFVPQVLKVFSHISWESLSYIGTTALAGVLTTFVLFSRKLLKKIPDIRNAEISFMTVMAGISILVLLFSFGIPFVFGLEWLTDYLGPVRQLRSLGRFAWLFYYVVNILIFSALYRKAFMQPATLLWKIAAGMAFLILFYEGYWNMKSNTGGLYNRITGLEDRENTTEENNWVNSINPTDFRALIPIPYFHNGSENIWIDGGHGSKETAMLVSLKTGLPVTGVELSRTSISQTFVNYALFMEPLQRLELPDFLKEDNKSFLVTLMNDYEPTEAEKWLLNGCSPVLKTQKFSLWTLPAEYIRNIHETWRQHEINQFYGARLYPREGHLVSDSLTFFSIKNFDKTPSEVKLRGDGAFTFPSRQWAVVWSDTLRNIPAGKKLILGFWIYGYQKDAYLRTNLELFRKNAVSGETTGYLYSDLFRHLKAFSGDWALVELEFETAADLEFVQLSLRNNVLLKASFTADELLIREKGTDIWSTEDNFLYRNGRKYIFK